MKKGLFALALGTFGLGITEYVMMSILPELAAQFGVSIASAGHLISAYALGVCVGAPLIVLFTRNWPLKRILLMLMVVYIAGNLGFTLSSDYTVALIMRFISGLPHGAYFGTGALVASRLVGVNRATSAVALMCMGMTVANLLGVPFGSLIGNTLSWRYIFMFVVGWGVITLLGLWLMVPRMAPLPPTNIKGQFRFLKKREPWLLIAATMLGNAGVFSMYSYVTPLITDVTGLSMGFIPVLMLLVGASMCIGTYYGGALSDRFTPPRMSYYIEIVIFVALMSLFLWAQCRWVIVPMVCLSAAALFAVSPPMQLLLIKYSPGGELMGGAMVQIAFNLGNALGALFGGFPVDSGAGVRYSSLIGAGFALTGVVVLYLFRRHIAQRLATPDR